MSFRCSICNLSKINGEKAQVPGKGFPKLDRNDQAINLFEIKFYQSPFVVSKEQADEFRLKTAIFKSATKTTKQVFFTLLTTFPIVPNEQSLSAVDIALDMNCLFETF